jgi:hypothetical protein
VDCWAERETAMKLKIAMAKKFHICERMMSKSIHLKLNPRP